MARALAWVRQRGLAPTAAHAGRSKAAPPPSPAAPSAPTTATPAPRPAPPPPSLPLPFLACTTVAIPALNEAEHIAGVVAFARADPATAEVLVIDDSSTDDTAARATRAGARVMTSTMLGKGASMADAVQASEHPFIVYLDGDLSGLTPGLVGKLVQPLLEDRADFVKARFERSGGRVTELTARPMLQVFFPELAGLAQPLGGIVAARRSLLGQLPFEDGWGVDIGLLIDAQLVGARIVEVDVGALQHESQPLADLTAMANEVTRTIYARARRAGRLHAEQVMAMLDAQRQAAASLGWVFARRRGRFRLLLLTQAALLDDAAVPATPLPPAVALGLDETRLAADAAVLRFVHRSAIEAAARAVPLRAGLVELVRRLKRCGFFVGVLSQGAVDVAEVLRRRVFADFALAHTLLAEHEVCTGALRWNPAFLPAQPEPGEAPAPRMEQVLEHFRAERSSGVLLECWAVGGAAADWPLLRAADLGLALQPLLDAQGEPAPPGLRRVASVQALLALVPASATPTADANAAVRLTAPA